MRLRNLAKESGRKVSYFCLRYTSLVSKVSHDCIHLWWNTAFTNIGRFGHVFRRPKQEFTHISLEPVMDGMKKQPRFGMVWEKEPRQHGHRKSGFNFLDSYRTFEKSCQWNELNQKLCRLLASIRNNCLEITFTGELSRSLSRSIFLIACDSLFNLKYLMLNAFCFIRHISTVVSTGVFLAYINFPW